MSGKGWHILRKDGALTVARHLPPRFDVVARTRLPAGHDLGLAHQIRQDMWRALKQVRGFSPVVRLTWDGDAWNVEAGGRVAVCAPGLQDRIQDVLNAPRLRARWITHATRKART